MYKQIPNIITLANLFSGCIAITMAFSGNFLGVVIWVLIAALFDFLDGFAARLLKVSSKLGIELDSLADVVSFGVAPASAIYILFKNHTFYPNLFSSTEMFIPYLAFLIPAFSAYRLAKFNIDTRQTSSFLGLPTPANGLFWVSYAYAMHSQSDDRNLYLYLTIILIVALSILMVSEVPMFSLKIKKIQFKGNEPQVIFLILTAILVVILGIAGLAWSILLYIFLSVITQKR